MSLDPFASPKRRLTRAKRNLRSIKERGKRFFAKEPHELVIDVDRDTNRDVYKLRLRRRLSPGFTDSVVECIEGLRAVLDLTGYACAMAAGCLNPKGTYFPIADSASQLDTDVIGRGRCKDIPADIVTLFRGFRPYKGGNDPIWALNKLCNTSKHKLIAPMAMGTDGSFFRYFSPPAGTQIFVPVWDSVKNEIPIFSVPGGTLPKYDLDVAYFVAFGDVEVVQGQPAIPVLYTIGSEVERILLATEAEARRTGLII